MRIVKYIVLILYIFLNPYPALLAHQGGHDTHEHANHHFWYNKKTNQIYEGTFLMFKDGNLFIEDSFGKILSIQLNELADEDRAFAEVEIKKIEHLNTYDLRTFKSRQSEKEKNSSFIKIFYFLPMFLILILIIAAFQKHRKIIFGAAFLASIVLCLIACEKDEELNSILKTDPLFLDAAFASFKPSVSTHWDDNYFYVESNGIPSHGMMTGVTSWQQQVPIPQSYTGNNSWAIPLKTELSQNPLSIETNFLKGAIAIAVNGIPIFNPLNNREEDASLAGELDNWGGHCGKADDYHYHLPPLHLQSQTGDKPIAFALDGFAVYGSNEGDGSSMQALDQYHGHTGSDGNYHYHGTTVYPYMIGAMRGNVALDPNTTAPENQITPQAMSQALRPPLTPLNGASITNFNSTGTNAYSLEYTLDNKKGYVNYNWDNTGKYTFEFINTSGNKTTEVYQRK